MMVHLAWVLFFAWIITTCRLVLCELKNRKLHLATERLLKSSTGIHERLIERAASEAEAWKLVSMATERLMVQHEELEDLKSIIYEAGEERGIN